MMTRAKDAEFVRACLKGDQSAFASLVEKYQRAIFNAALRMTGDAEDAKDITQTVFVKAFENLASYDSTFKFYSWIYRIAVNESINQVHRKERLEPLVAERVSLERGPEAACALEELRGQVQDALMTLKPEYRSVIVLRHFLSCSYEEIGEILRVPAKTVKSRLFTARQLLKEALESRGILA